MRGAERAAEGAGSHALGGDRSSATDRGRPELRRVLAVSCRHQTSYGIRQVAAQVRWCRGPHEIWGLTPRLSCSPHGLALPQTGWRHTGDGTGSGWNQFQLQWGFGWGLERPWKTRAAENPGGEAGRRPLSCGAVPDFDSTQSGGLHFRSLKNGANGGFRWVPRPTSTR